ncbi:ABC transporter permease [Haloferax denitrificans]|uniref:Sugar ABC transporter permease n=1 Tax=Haloferax denitrificans ATCC 35960 TaxID=662478 RepID=M0JH57_9EURY|nr:ABC transporter permease [Haloferax denitrificans]EMA08331.1 sugar ABC transporter permease [Haloferax denitrificans ATCC 35960]
MSDAATGVRSLADRIADHMLDASVLERVVIALVATALALLIGAVIVAASGYDAVEFVSSLVYGAVGNASNLAFMLRQSSMLILTGVAVAVAFRAGVFNIGVQGQFVVGGFAATLGILFAAPLLPNSSISAVPLMALAALLALAAGGAYGALPGMMKVYAGANEVITTIMLNFIASGVVYFLLDAYLRPEGAAAPNTEQFPDYVGLPGLVFESPSFSILGLGVALLTVAVVYLVMDRTGFGYDLVTSGYQEPAAKYSGVDPKRMIVRTMTISGMIAGLAGALFAIMILGYYSDPNTFPTFGFDAIAVSLLAANNPLGVIPAGLLFGGLDAGGQYIGFTLDVPSELVDGVIGLIVLFVAAPELFRAAGRYTSLGGDRE